VLWIHVNDHLEMGPFFWFGGPPGRPLPSIDAFRIPRRATHNKVGVRPERANHRLVPPGEFKRLSVLDEVLVALFGELPK